MSSSPLHPGAGAHGSSHTGLQGKGEEGEGWKSRPGYRTAVGTEMVKVQCFDSFKVGTYVRPF